MNEENTRHNRSQDIPRAEMKRKEPRTLPFASLTSLSCVLFIHFISWSNRSPFVFLLSLLFNGMEWNVMKRERSERRKEQRRTGSVGRVGCEIGGSEWWKRDQPKEQRAKSRTHSISFVFCPLVFCLGLFQQIHHPLPVSHSVPCVLCAFHAFHL